MTRLSLEQANVAIAAAFAEGVRLGLKPLTVAVLDAGGTLLALQRHEDTSLLRPEIAIGKAASALGLGMASGKIAAMASERPAFVAALGQIAPHGMIPAAGGVLVLGEEDRVVGAIGVTGDTSDNDELCAVAGIKAAGLIAGF
ncbi:heme-binding protein [soil metagenome]